jgi:tight adherence protein C
MVQTDPNFVWIITAIAFMAFFLLCIGVLQYSRVRSKQQEMVAKIRSSVFSTRVASDDLSGEKVSLRAGLAEFFSRLGNRYVPQNTVDYSKMRTKFLRAGIRSQNASSILWGTKIFLLIFFPAIFLACRLTILNIVSNPLSLAISLFLALMGFYLPDIWLQNKGERRRAKLLEGLPDALDLLVVCVEAGMGIDGAFNRVAEEIKLSNPELSDEFKLLNLELRAGKSRQDALRNLSARSGLEEVESLVTLLIQTDKFGTSVASALKIYSDTFRTQRYQRAEEIAAKLTVKLIFPLILFIFPALFVVIMGPAAISVYNTFIAK